eukprot:PLAT1925.1.p1 GENE.PLAT1925.1~~PLAT1925.1.p1  ORF type:complete len:211 (+),score=11.02 PLAT1925.1:44-676(+)
MDSLLRDESRPSGRKKPKGTIRAERKSSLWDGLGGDETRGRELPRTPRRGVGSPERTLHWAGSLVVAQEKPASRKKLFKTHSRERWAELDGSSLPAPPRSRRRQYDLGEPPRVDWVAPPRSTSAADFVAPPDEAIRLEKEDVRGATVTVVWPEEPPSPDASSEPLMALDGTSPLRGKRKPPPDMLRTQVGSLLKEESRLRRSPRSSRWRD